MTRSLMWLAKLEVTERHVLDLLRQGWANPEKTSPGEVGPAPGPTAGAAGILAELGKALRASTIDIRGPEAQLVSADEVWLLGALALAQRTRLRTRIARDFAHQAALDACGLGLLALRIKLPFGAIGRHLASASTLGTQATAPKPRASLALASPRVRAMHLLQSQETVSAKQFVANGVPYKLIGEMCRLGLIRRQARGVYVRSV